MKSIRLGVFALTVSACSAIVGETPIETAPVPTTAVPTTELTQTTTTTIPGDRTCVHHTGGTAPVATGSVATDALALSGEIFVCADDVVVVAEDDINEVATAAQLAAALGGPLLHPHPQLAAELGRLKPFQVHVIGDLEVQAPPDATMIRHTISNAVDQAKVALGLTSDFRLPSTPDASTIVETLGAITAQDRVVLPQTAPPTGTSMPTAPAIDPVQLVAGLARPTSSDSIWLMDASSPVGILSAAGTGRAVNAGVIAFDPANLLAYPQVGSALAGRPSESIRFVGTTSEVDSWQLAVLASGRQVPGGGFHVLPAGRPRRYVAFYGHPKTVGLGALGEQGPEETLARMQPLLTEYAADGYQVIPTFEIDRERRQRHCDGRWRLQLRVADIHLRRLDIGRPSQRDVCHPRPAAGT